MRQNRAAEAADRPSAAARAVYRADADFTTEVAFVNYLTFYLLDADIGITVIATAYDRSGKRLGSGRHRVGRKQALQRPLAELVGAARRPRPVWSPSRPSMTRLPSTHRLPRQTAPQFMTLFVPKAQGAAAPQILHSHKGFQRRGVPYSPCRWAIAGHRTPLCGRVLQRLAVNACGSKLAGRVELGVVARQSPATCRADYSVPARGVGRIDLQPAALDLPLDQPLPLCLRLRPPHSP